MSKVKRWLAYWRESLEQCQEVNDMIIYFVFFISVMIALAGKAIGIQIPTLDFLAEPLTHEIALGLSLILLLWILTWLPFQRHEAEKIKTDAEKLELKNTLEQKITALDTEIASIKSLTKRRFLAFMAQLRAEIDNVDPANWTNFVRNKIPNIKHEAALIVDDFNPKQRDVFENMYIYCICDSHLDTDIDCKVFLIGWMENACEFVKNPPNYPE
jgi:hypothetical protein